MKKGLILLVIMSMVFSPITAKAQAVPTPGRIAAIYTCSTNYFVNGTTGNDSNPGTSSGSAWATIGKSISAMQALATTLPNTCINVAAGTYNEARSGDTILGGSPSGYLTWISTTLNGAIITIPPAQAHSFVGGFKFENANYIGIDGFSIQGANYVYTVTVTAANATQGATYTNNGHTFTVITTIAGGTTLLLSDPGGTDSMSGTTLTKTSGTGDSTITFSAVAYANDAGITNSGNVSGAGATSLDSHLFIANNILNNNGSGGIGLNHSDYLLIEGNTVTNSSHTITDFNVQTSGISTYQQVAAYTITATSTNTVAADTYTNNGKTCTITQTLTGATTLIMFCTGDPAASGTLTRASGTGPATITFSSVASSSGFHTIIGWNVLANNKTIINTNSHSDGNGIIVDDSDNTQNSSPYTAYAKTTEVVGNLAYNNGGGGVHIYLSNLVTVANNTVYGNYTDLADTSNPRGDINFSASSNCTAANNIGWGVIGTGALANNAAFADYSFSGTANTGNTWYSNLSYNGTNGQSAVQFKNTGGSPTTNAVYSTSTPYFNIAGSDPVFISLAANNFVISIASPAATAGNATYAPAFDLNGSPISGSIPIGAYLPSGTPPPSLIKATIGGGL